MIGTNAARLRRIVAILTARLDRAERAHAGTVNAIAVAQAAARAAGAEIARAPISGAQDADYVVFAERRRAHLRRAVAALSMRLAALDAEREQRRHETAALLRQVKAIESRVAALAAAAKRSRERR